MTRMTGTYRYMAPEVVAGDANYCGKADVYSATMVLYTLVTGTLPFERVRARVCRRGCGRGIVCVQWQWQWQWQCSGAASGSAHQTPVRSCMWHLA